MNDVIISDTNSIKAEMEDKLNVIPNEIFDKAVNNTPVGIKMSFMFNKCLTLDDTARLVEAGFPVVEPLGDYMDRLSSEIGNLKKDDSVVNRCPETGLGTLCTVKECREGPCPITGS